MATPLGAHNARVDFARELLTKKGRREHGHFTFEGPTLLTEALAAHVSIESLYVTQAQYSESAQARELEAHGVPVYLLDDRTMRKISDLETPSGLVAIAPMRFAPLEEIFAESGVILILADVNDPGNAGTLLRTAEAFGVGRVLFGSRGVEPYHPKVVRGAMGALFRLRLAVAAAEEVGRMVDGWQGVGLGADGEPLVSTPWSGKDFIVVGNERHGLGRWSALCTRTAAIPMRGKAESLNAGVAGSIALYEATKRPSPA